MTIREKMNACNALRRIQDHMRSFPAAPRRSITQEEPEIYYEKILSQMFLIFSIFSAIFSVSFGSSFIGRIAAETIMNAKDKVYNAIMFLEAPRSYSDAASCFDHHSG